jgi:hypothetical protein
LHSSDSSHSHSPSRSSHSRRSGIRLAPNHRYWDGEQTLPPRSLPRSHAAGEQGRFAAENRPETNEAETGHKRHYRTLGRGVRAPAPGRLLGSTRPTRRASRCLLAGSFPPASLGSSVPTRGKLPSSSSIRRSRLHRTRRASSERRPWMAVANVRRRDMGSPEPHPGGARQPAASSRKTPIRRNLS